MAVINAYNCLTGTKNTGKQECVFEMREMKGVIFIPKGKTFAPGDITDFKTTLSALATNVDPKLRIYPVGTFVDFEDESSDPQSTTTGYGFEKMGRPGTYKWTFSYDNGICYHKSILTFRNQQNRFDALLVDGQGAIWGVKTSTGFKGFDLSQIYPHNATLPTGGDPVWNQITISLSDATQFNENLGFVYDKDFSPLTELPGMLDVAISQVSITDTNLVIHAEMNCGALNLADVFGNDLADVTLWTFINQSTNVPKVPTSVAIANGNFVFVFTTVTGVAHSAQLADGATLEAAGVVSPTGSFLESNKIISTFL